MKTMKRKTQKEVVLWHLQNHGTITSWEAIKEYGITRLAARVFYLKEDGHDIETETKQVENRFGKTNITIYKLSNVH